MPHTCCDTTATTALKSLDDALAELQLVAEALLESRPPKTQTVSLSNALNRILSKDVYSALNVPPAANSAVDGYALNSEDYTSSSAMFVSQRIPAGVAPQALEKNTVARIFTGAHVPEGANCVVMQENTRQNAEKTHISISDMPHVKQNIRAMGQDIKSGERILSQGQVLTPQRLGLLASIGLADIEVFEPLNVAILSTGDELVEPGSKLKEGQIYNSNRYLLNGLLSNLHVSILDFGLVPDNLDSTLSTLEKAAAQADIIITTGGASVGEEDYIQAAISQLGKLDFWKVAIKPGKPFMLGQINHTPVLGLPGNPSAVLVTFMMLARPFLLHRQGLNKLQPKPYLLPINFDIKKASIRREFLRVIRKEGQLELHPNQSSGMLSSASWAEGLAVILENTTPKKGESLAFIPFEALLYVNN